MGSIYCIGRNYVAHAAELNNPIPKEPVIFLKSWASLRGTKDRGTTAYPDESFHFETEVILVVGKKVPLKSKAGWEAVRGLRLGLDLTRREKQEELKKAGLPWTLAKSFDGAAVVSDEIEAGKFSNLDKIHFSFSLNGQLKQQGDTSEMLFSVPKILEAISNMHTLQPGDLIFTGTPKGVDKIKAGDSFELRWDDLGLSFAGQL